MDLNPSEDTPPVLTPLILIGEFRFRDGFIVECTGEVIFFLVTTVFLKFVRKRKFNIFFLQNKTVFLQISTINCMKHNKYLF